MSIRRCPVPIVNVIVSKGGKFVHCRKSHNQSDVSLNITFLLNFAIHFDNQAFQTGHRRGLYMLRGTGVAFCSQTPI
jgi:hypothetical protein